MIVSSFLVPVASRADREETEIGTHLIRTQVGITCEMAKLRQTVWTDLRYDHDVASLWQSKG
jgi:hypothetical protein